MGQLIFRNKWIALIWVIGLMASLAVFFGKGGGVESLDDAAARLRGQQAGLSSAETGEQSGLDPASAEEEEEPADEPSLAPETPEPGDVVTGQDGRRYRVVQASPVPESAPAEVPAN